MKKAYKKGIVASALATTALLICSQAFAAHTDDIILRDSGGTPLALGSDVAYSAKTTCGECHDYAAIERHSYHAQLGANEHKGFDAYKFGNWGSGAAKSKPWVQSTGHVGKW